MSGFVLQVLTCGLGFGIGYLFNTASPKLWRLLVGFFVGFVVSWLAGIIIWGSVFMPNDKFDAIVSGMPKSFLFAIVGAGTGVYFGRRKAKASVPKVT